MIDVSCIIINYNTANFTIAATKSILEMHDTSGSLEIVVVDNASKPGEFKRLQDALKKESKVKLIRSKINTGFGGGNMIGVNHATKAKYYAFINNDTLQVSKNCLWQLQDFMQNTADAAICSPQMLDEDKNFMVSIDHFSSLGREILRRPLLEKLFPKTYLNRKIRYKKPTKVHYVQGAFMFCDAESFNKVGGFDTNLFLYYEESDLSRRILKNFEKHSYLVPNLEYIHYKSKSTQKNISIKIEQKISLLYYIRKHYGFWQHKVLLSYYLVRYFFSSIVKPKYWQLFGVFLIGAPLSKSLKMQQQLQEEV